MAGYRVTFRHKTTHRFLTYAPEMNVHSRHPTPCANGNMIHYSSVRESIDGKFSLLLLEVKVHKTVLNTGYTTSGANYCSTVWLQTPPPLLSTVFQHVLKYNTIFTYFLYLCVET
jgi:hypothetical protein